MESLELSDNMSKLLNVDLNIKDAEPNPYSVKFNDAGHIAFRQYDKEGKPSKTITLQNGYIVRESSTDKQQIENSLLSIEKRNKNLKVAFIAVVGLCSVALISGIVATAVLNRL